MSRKINIALSFNDGYAEQATTMLYSLLENNQGHSFQIFIFYNDLKPCSKEKILSSFSKFSNFEIEWMVIDGSLIQSFIRRRGHVNEYAYTRIFMPMLLDKVDRFLYLDCDMLVLRDILELWETNLQGKTFAAIEDPSPFERHLDLGMPEEKKYFNSGVILFDAQQWREKNYTSNVVDTLHQLGDKAAWWEQDGLNASFYNDWLPLENKWNIQSHDIMLAQKANYPVKDQLSPSNNTFHRKP